MMKIAAFAAALSLPLLLTACGSSHTEVTNRLVTQEQQMTDLKRALDYGAISQTEYNEQTKKVMTGQN
ncbi:MAG: hypothetical protein ABWY00_00835 [Dongiaceae bacterium]